MCENFNLLDNCTLQSFNKWSQIPYPEQTKVYHGIDPTAGSWPLYYFKNQGNGVFTTLDGSPISWEIMNPSNVNFIEELKEVQYVQAHITEEQIKIAKYWGNGVPLNQIIPIALQLINTYKITPPKSARILSSVGNTLNDAFILTWYFKYLWDYPRPCQLDRSLNTILATPQFPTYPSGHSVVSSASAVILSYYFPKEKSKLYALAQEASISRLYGGIHFRSDLSQGIRLGKQIGRLVVTELKKEADKDGVMVDVPRLDFLDAPIIPKY
ncbi:vanadium-dependent haloperoxidase [Clostridium uliginosum]|uniref:PAP2 superfamily protein n=1 Tax=Clostridium uliginosum TaxID=119641 RepID=A0A1I1PF72_9CLOT|nr:vanadium-dependent haloperoxidase [Clostridium uliginosum]SFD08531.1 PAP2 superfamily protein [Clostridium uliginosum]